MANSSSSFLVTFVAEQEVLFRCTITNKQQARSIYRVNMILHPTSLSLQLLQLSWFVFISGKVGRSLNHVLRSHFLPAAPVHLLLLIPR